MCTVEFEVQKFTISGWQRLSLWNDPVLAKGVALRIWNRVPEERPGLRVIRLGANHPAYVFKAGLFRKNAGAWQRIPDRRFCRLLANTTCA